MRSVVGFASIKAELEMKHRHLTALTDNVLRHVKQIASNGSGVAIWAGPEFVHHRRSNGLE